MPSPDAWDTLPSEELRAAFAAHRPEPSELLRTRVADVLVAPIAPPRRRRRAPQRRYLLAGASLVAACAVAAVVALSLTGGSTAPREVALGPDEATLQEAAPSSAGQVDNAAVAGAATATPATTGAAPAPGPQKSSFGTVTTPSPTRLQDYSAEIHLRVRGTQRLSQVTQRAISLTRGYNGYVTRSNVTLHGRSGTAQVNVRVPVAKVQDAIARFSALGTITGQHVAVADLQHGYDAATQRIESLRHSLALIDVRLADPKLTPERRVGLLAQQERARHALAGAKETATGLAARGAFARIDLSFATAAPHVTPVVAQHPGRFEHALRRAGGMLETAGIAGLFVAILGGPLLVVAGLVLLATRRGRRRREQALLERA